MPSEIRDSRVTFRLSSLRFAHSSESSLGVALTGFRQLSHASRRTAAGRYSLRLSMYARRCAPNAHASLQCYLSAHRVRCFLFPPPRHAGTSTPCSPRHSSLREIPCPFVEKVAARRPHGLPSALALLRKAASSPATGSGRRFAPTVRARTPSAERHAAGVRRADVRERRSLLFLLKS